MGHDETNVAESDMKELRDIIDQREEQGISVSEDDIQ